MDNLAYNIIATTIQELLERDKQDNEFLAELLEELQEAY